jgi:hypothetical protein
MPEGIVPSALGFAGVEVVFVVVPEFVLAGWLEFASLEVLLQPDIKTDESKMVATATLPFIDTGFILLCSNLFNLICNNDPPGILLEVDNSAISQLLLFLILPGNCSLALTKFCVCSSDSLPGNLTISGLSIFNSCNFFSLLTTICSLLD